MLSYPVPTPTRRAAFLLGLVAVLSFIVRWFWVSFIAAALAAPLAVHGFHGAWDLVNDYFLSDTARTSWPKVPSVPGSSSLERVSPSWLARSVKSNTSGAVGGASRHGNVANRQRRMWASVRPAG